VTAEAYAVNIPDLLNRMEAQYKRMSTKNAARVVLLQAAEVIVEQGKQLTLAQSKLREQDSRIILAH
jgi:hypothetical protein